MSHFSAAYEYLQRNERGFVDHPSDPGGATNRGISLRTLRKLGDMDFDIDGDSDLDVDDVEALTIEDAIDFYRRYFWKPEYEAIDDWRIAAKIFDMSVNMDWPEARKKQSIKLLQRALNVATADAVGFGALMDDGIFGSKTLARVNALPANRVLVSLASTCAYFYFNLVDKKTARMVFLLGWLRRAYDLPGGEHG